MLKSMHKTNHKMKYCFINVCWYLPCEYLLYDKNLRSFFTFNMKLIPCVYEKDWISLWNILYFFLEINGKYLIMDNQWTKYYKKVKVFFFKCIKTFIQMFMISLNLFVNWHVLFWCGNTFNWVVKLTLFKIHY